MQIRQLIKKSLVKVEPNVSIRDVVKLMIENNIGFVVVTKNDKLLGVVSERDILKAIANNVDLSKPIEEIMNRNVITIYEDEDIGKAAKLMHEYKIRHLVVVDRNNKPIGVISIRDIVDEETVLKNLKITGYEFIYEESQLKVTT